MNEDVALVEAAKLVVGGGTQDPLCNRRSAKGRNLHRLRPKYSGNHQPGKNQENNQETNQETTDFCDFGFSTLTPYFAVTQLQLMSSSRHLENLGSKNSL